MKTSLKSAEDTISFPPGMSREDVMGKLRIVLKQLGWTFSEQRVGYSATTPLTLKSTGETIEIEVGSSLITIKSHGGMATFALTSKKYHIANVESVINGFITLSSIATVFNHTDFIEKTRKAFALLQAGVLGEAEFNQTKAKALHNLNRGSLAITPTAFLMELAPFLQSGAITRAEIGEIKSRIL